MLNTHASCFSQVINSKSPSKAIDGVVYIDGVSHKLTVKKPHKKGRAQSRRLDKPSTREPVDTEELKRKVKRLQTTKKLRHAIMLKETSRSRFQNIMDEYKRRSVSPALQNSYEHTMADPVLKASNKLFAQRAMSTKRGQMPDQKRNVVKSIGMI